MVHLPSSIGPFTEEISIHILTKECYLIIFHSILGSERETCILIQSFIACFVSPSSRACSWAETRGLVQYDIFFFPPSLKILSRCKFLIVPKIIIKNLVCLISHLADRLHTTQTAGFSCIAGNLFPIVGSLEIREFTKKVIYQEDKVGFMKADRSVALGGQYNAEN